VPARALLLLLAVPTVSGCGGSKKDATTATTTAAVAKEPKEGPNAPCGAADPAMAGKPQLPPGFPTPANVVYTKQKQDGPSHVVFGYRGGDLTTAFNAYKSAIAGAAGYVITHAEHDPADAEVNYAGHGTTGQVRLNQRCSTRTSITIIARLM
jgi:hypothetical protein